MALLQSYMLSAQHFVITLGCQHPIVLAVLHAVIVCCPLQVSYGLIVMGGLGISVLCIASCFFVSM